HLGVPPTVATLLDHLPAVQDIQELCSTADTEEIDIGVLEPIKDRDLEGIPLLVRSLGSRASFLTINRRIDVSPTHETDSIISLHKVEGLMITPKGSIPPTI